MPENFAHLSNMPNLVHIFYVIIFLSISVSSQNKGIFFSGFNDVGTNLSLTGVAEIEKNGILRLTNDTSRLMGRAIYSFPIKLKSSNTGKAFSFSTSFVFSIVPEYPKLGGHGFAFTIGPSKVLKALPSQYLGLLTNASDNGNFSNHLFAVEFDTVQDFEFQDINDNHVGIDINGLNSNKSIPASFYDEEEKQSKDLNLKSRKPIQAWVDYDSVENVLNVTISLFSEKPKLPLMSFPVDLSPIFHEFMYVGFSASTGLLASSHYIYGWSFAVNGQTQALDLNSLPSIPSVGDKKKKLPDLAIGVSVSVLAFVLSAIAISIYIFMKMKNSDPIEAWELELGPHRYSYQELKQATKGFKETELLGFGGFGKVYKGTLPNSKTQIAVKRISHDSKQGLQEFVSEIASIGRLRHRNLVQLMGWCRRKSDLLLVYDFMANGSLDKILFEEPKTTLNWEQRFKIIKGVASALLYLHEGYEQVVLHRDVKASNVLLDNELNGRLGDFGLARLHEHGSYLNTTRVVGTLGYLAPELPRTGKATTSSDVFAFGALLLEVACGRRPIEHKAKAEELVLVDWVLERYRDGSVLEVVDSRLNGQVDEAEMLIVLKLGLMCSHNLATARPNMRQLVRFLDGEIGIPDDLEVPDDLKTASGFDEDRAIIDGFNDFLHSFASSSIDNMSTSHSFPENRDVDSSFTSHSLLHTRGETTR